jgi:hypothetical protein
MIPAVISRKEFGLTALGPELFTDVLELRVRLQSTSK